MDVFDSPYYRINKFLLSCVGQWPYQNSLHKRVIRISILVFSISFVVPQILQVIEVWGDLDAIVECAYHLVTEVINATRFINYIVNDEKMRELNDHMCNDWKITIDESERRVLRSYADKGRKLSEFYCAYMYMFMCTFMMIMLMPKILDFVKPLNETRVFTFLIPVKYGDIDKSKHCFLVVLHSDCFLFLTVTAIVAVDTMYAVYVEHACGLFATLGDKITRLLESEPEKRADQLSPDLKEDMKYKALVTCVKMHEDAIEFAKMIEACHAVPFFFVLGLLVLAQSILGYQMITKLDKPGEAVLYAGSATALLLYILFINWPGQKLIDHSEGVREWVYGSQWYFASTRCKKLLMLIMLRSQDACTLTAGKLYVMSMENFSMVLKTAASYFTMLNSFR